MDRKIEYPKIDTLFERDQNFNVIPEKLKKPVLGTINQYVVTEKIDGTNIRIMLDKDGNIEFGGRSNNASIPADLITYLQKTFTPEKLKEVLWRKNEAGETEIQEVILYGEGYGAGIQKCGKEYRPDKAFILFDVLIDGKWWLDWKNVEGIAESLGIKSAPFLGLMSLSEIVELVKTGFHSIVALEDSGQELLSEGVVAKPLETLFDKRGQRIILKLKTIDFNHPPVGETVPKGGETDV